MDHITIDEMMTFLQADGLTPEVMELGNKINCHIYRCEECRKVYFELLEATERIKEATSDVLAARAAEADTVSGFESIKNVFSTYLENAKEKVEEITELIIEVAFHTFTEVSAANYIRMQPSPVGYAKSVHGSSTEDTVLKSIVKDETNNITINIGLDGTLTVRLPDMDVKDAVLCSKSGEELTNIDRSIKKSFDGSTVVTFYDCEVGDYNIKIKKIDK